jgi:hypothetical protein
MNRLPQKRSSASKSEPDPNGQGKTAVAAEPSSSAGPVTQPIPLGWRLAVLVWVCGFIGLFVYELFGLFWKLLVRS